MSSQKKIPQLSPIPPLPPKKSPWRFAFFLVVALCGWLFFRSITPTLPQVDAPPHLYSNPSHEDLRLTLLSAIQKAHDSIHLVMFGLNDPAILSALAKKSEAQIATTLYYDPGGSPNLRDLFPKASIHPVHQSGLMHQKILVLDDTTVFLGSANFTTYSLKMHNNLMVGFVSPRVARFLKEHPPCSSGYLKASVGGQPLEIWLLPDKKGHALNEIKKQLRAAKQTIQIALFTFTHEGLAEELIYAKKRGVRVQVAIDLHSALGASHICIEKLKAGGIPIFYSPSSPLLHHKFALLDNQILIMGSANWTQSAFQKNSDCILALHALNHQQKKFMQGLWKDLEASARKKSLPNDLAIP